MVVQFKPGDRLCVRLLWGNNTYAPYLRHIGAMGTCEITPNAYGHFWVLDEKGERWNFSRSSWFELADGPW